MDSDSAFALSMLTGEYGNYSKLLDLFVFSCPKSPVQDQLPVTIPFGTRYVSPIVATTLGMPVSIFSVIMSSYEQIWELAELSNMTDEQ